MNYFDLECSKCGAHLGYGIDGDFNCLKLSCGNCVSEFIKEEETPESPRISP